MEKVKAPVTVYIASRGMCTMFSEDMRSAWGDFGAHALNRAKVVSVEGDHYEFLESQSFLNALENNWGENGSSD